MLLGERIKQYRDTYKLTQVDLACRLGVTSASVSAYENGSRLPSYDILVKIANILGITTDELLGRTNKQNETIDVSALTPEQRKEIGNMVDIYKNFNQISQSMK